MDDTISHLQAWNAGNIQFPACTHDQSPRAICVPLGISHPPETFATFLLNCYLAYVNVILYVGQLRCHPCDIFKKVFSEWIVAPQIQEMPKYSRLMQVIHESIFTPRIDGSNQITQRIILNIRSFKKHPLLPARTLVSLQKEARSLKFHFFQSYRKCYVGRAKTDSNQIIKHGHGHRRIAPASLAKLNSH